MQNNKICSYEAPSVDIVTVDARDVITTSAGDLTCGDTPIMDIAW